MKKIAAIPTVLNLRFLLFALATGGLLPLATQAQTDPLPETYKFKLGITYEISSGDKKGQELSMWYSEDGYSGIEAKAGAGMFMVYDMKSMKMITLMEAQKMAMVMDMNKVGQQYQAKTEGHEKTATDTKVTKTGNTAQILGYTCDEYKTTSEKTTSTFWITTALGSGFGDYAKSMMMALGGGSRKTQGTDLPDLKGAENGVMLKMEATDQATNKVTRFEATSVNKEGKTITTSGYKMMSIPGQ